jgi:catalase
MQPLAKSAGAGGRLTQVGKLTRDCNVADFYTEIEQATFEPNNSAEVARAQL